MSVSTDPSPSGDREPARVAALTTFFDDRTQPAARGNASNSDWLPSRYQDLGPVARGGQGQVIKAWDHHVGRMVAIKMLHRSVETNHDLRALQEEVRIAGRLHHPNIVGVHTWGRARGSTPRIFLVLPFVEGQTLRQAVHDCHRGEGRWTPLRLVSDVFAPLCRTLRWVHRNGVVHRDIKPGNVLIREDDHHFLVDWGLADARGRRWNPAFEEPPLAPTAGGTPATMAPEVAEGSTRLDPRVDVYGLGAILYWILAGRPPFTGTRAEIVDQLQAGHPPIPPPEPEPAGLVDICLRALSADPNARPADAGVLEDEVNRWLERRQRHQEAHQAVQHARRLKGRRTRLLRSIGEQMGAAVDMRRRLGRAPAPAEFEAVWAHEDGIEALRTELALVGEEIEETLRGALVLEPHHPRARTQLAAWIRERHEEAEDQGDGRRAARLLARLRAVGGEQQAAYVSGASHVRIHLARAAHVTIRRVQDLGPLRVARGVVWTGTTAVVDIDLPVGRYLAEVRTDEAVRFVLPFRLLRAASLELGGARSRRGPVPVPGPGAFDPTTEVFVPGGWQRVGGDAQASGDVTLPATEAWVPDLIVRRDTVDNEAWRAHLDAVRAVGGPRATEGLLPRTNRRGGLPGDPIIDWDAVAGRHVIGSDLQTAWRPQDPVTYVSFDAATRYAAWLASSSGLPWVLPSETEFERYARGIDHFFSWGNGAEPGFCRNRDHQGGPRMGPLASGEAGTRDESLFGVRCVCGNVSEWTRDRYLRRQAFDPAATAVREDTKMVAIRGGHYLSGAAAVRLASRQGMDRGSRSPAIGVRVVRPYSPG